ncbi:Hypothetical Protein FCC1311_061272 [Hondaea fermentalgiana]|uniref:Uncharacterized protein n=1 Tax=Hondaea fermentalgiana TaxID=2315210 RepID=A0A2R5GG96_9STRA|nr:Hypothetical Protein FCC1311_061272 [Hondaea fermentalgiana]|eukprot:GBG29907.1 Hypothetical Protein FCC1311_061272 [Hondaea fermentalgiana]
MDENEDAREPLLAREEAGAGGVADDEAGAGTGDGPQSATLGPVFRSYLVGQSAYGLRVSLWWVGLSPLMLALVGNENVLGAVRVAFNVALLVVSPFAGVLAGRMKLEKILTATTFGRGAIYVVLLPLLWLFFAAPFRVVDSPTTLFVLVVVLCFIDGIQVALANVVDVDMGGTDILGAQKGLTVTDAMRNKLNSVFHICFDTSFLVFTPSVALLAWYIGELAVDQGRSKEDEDALKSGVLVCTFAGVFLVTSLISLYCYIYGLGGAPDAEGDYQVAPGDETELNEGANSAPANAQETAEEDSGILKSLWEGAVMTWSTRPIRWRLLFLGLEVAVEDAMVAVIVTEYAFTSHYFGDGDATRTNLFTALIVAVGKVGAVVAGFFMHSCWAVPTKKKGFRPLFASVLLASASVWLLVVAYGLERSAPNDIHGKTAWISRVLVFLSVTLFFLLSTAPKIGFETLLQGMVTSVEKGEKIFGFVGPFISIVDSIVVMGISLAFSMMKGNCSDGDFECQSSHFLSALSIIAAFYLAHGIFEALLGPRLMLPDDQDMLNKMGLNQADN